MGITGPASRPGKMASALRLAACFIVAAGCFAMSGCIASSGATDGGIPLGSPRGTLTGVVVIAASPTTPYAGAALSLLDSDNGVYTGVTAIDGTYSFPAPSVGPAILQVTPDPRSGLAAQRLSIVISPDSTKSVVVSLAPETDYQAATAVTLAPRFLSLVVGQSAAMDAHVIGPGLASNALPSLVVSGGVGQILPTGKFIATHRGGGSITATFGGQTATINVVVR